jgi:hypothetical protein
VLHDDNVGNQTLEPSAQIVSFLSKKQTLADGGAREELADFGRRRCLHFQPPL